MKRKKAEKTLRERLIQDLGASGLARTTTELLAMYNARHKTSYELATLAEKKRKIAVSEGVNKRLDAEEAAKKPAKKPKAPVMRASKVNSNEFLLSPEWRRIRYDALKANNGSCELCGRCKHDGIVLNVDHIKPRKTHPQLALILSNLQVLCNLCNEGKGNRDSTDWRLAH